MSSEVEEFHQRLFQDVLGAADADETYTADAFFDYVTAHLVEAGELETADRAYYASARSGRVDGYGGDPNGALGVLNLIISEFEQSPAIGSLTQTKLDAAFRRLTNFLGSSLKSDFRDALEESSPAYGLADLVATRWPTIVRIRMIVISNQLLSQRVEGREAGTFDERPVTYSVWDLGRLQRYVDSGNAREEIIVDFQEDFGAALTALPAAIGTEDYEAYLAVVPGEQLAAIYDRWGTRLLEQNVRCFLQARSNVNKGIRNTLDNEPDMFFAYNNGITATAERVDTESGPNGMGILRIQNLQIVNGGQTTASVHAARRRAAADLSKVFVQMKLSVVNPKQAVEIVPRISEYANSQNRVNAADFFANHPFHVRMEDFSRRVYAPSPDGTFRETKWFYERARGQYQDARAYMTATERKRFDAEHPRRQMFSKTDLAKYLNVWNGRPETVSRGAQKNFADFAGAVGKEWRKSNTRFNEQFYRHSIAKAIIFKAVEKLVSAQRWYQGGYRANIVAYAIAKLGHEVAHRNLHVDFDGVWAAQSMPAPLEDALVELAELVNDVIVSPPEGMRNVTEWAKKQACWHRVQALPWEIPSELMQILLSPRDHASGSRAAISDQRLVDGIAAQTAVVGAGPGFWSQVLQWGQTRKLLVGKDVGILRVAVEMPNKLPSEKQALHLVCLLERLHSEGCQLVLPS